MNKILDAPRGSAREAAVNSEKDSQNAPRAGAATREKQREGRQFQAEFARRSMRQRGHPPKTARGFAIRVKNSHGATKRAFRRARNPQRVRRATLKFAWHHNESVLTHQARRGLAREFRDSHGATAGAIRHAEGSPTSTKPAEGWQTTLKIRTAPQRERSDMHETRGGFAAPRRAKPTPALEIRENRRSLWTV